MIIKYAKFNFVHCKQLHTAHTGCVYRPCRHRGVLCCFHWHFIVNNIIISDIGSDIDTLSLDPSHGPTEGGGGGVDILEVPDEDGLVAAEGEAPAQPIRGEDCGHVTRCRAPIGHLVSRCRSTMSSCTGSRLIRFGWVHSDGAGHRVR